jgi:hypothetical protein
MSIYSNPSNRASKGFSLIEVVLAIGIFLVTVLALVGLLGPTLKSINEVEQSDEVGSIVHTVNTFLQTSPDIAPNVGDSKFESIYSAIADDGYASLIVYRWFDDAAANNGPPVIEQEIGFLNNEGGAIDALAVVNSNSDADYVAAAGKIYRIVLTASSVLPDEVISDNGENAYPRYLLTQDFSNYSLGYLALEVRIFALPADMEAVRLGTIDPTDVSVLADEDAAFVYPVAIVR